MSYESRAGSGISPFDVERYVRQLQRDHSGICGFDIGVPVRQTNGRALTVRCWFRRPGADTGRGSFERGVSSSWPSGECKTFTGLLFRLVIELDKKLSDEAETLRRAATDRLPGF
jgi:hypothetical protein